MRVHVLGSWPRSVMTRDLTGSGHRVFGMARKGPTDQDGAEAVRRLLSGLARGDDVFDLAAAIEELHPRHNTFPGEVFMRLSADALEVAGVRAGRSHPLYGIAREIPGRVQVPGAGEPQDPVRDPGQCVSSWRDPAGSARRGGLVAGRRLLVACIGCCGCCDPRLRRQDASIGAGLRSAVVSPVGDHPVGRVVWARRALTRCRRCRSRPAVVPSRDWQQAGSVRGGQVSR